MLGARLLEREPPIAHRRIGKDLVTVGVGEVRIGDSIFVMPGEVVAADGVLTTPNAVLDESALSGESKPVELKSGTIVRSGGTNVGHGFELRVTAPAAQSTYAGIVRLVRAAAAWAISNDPKRALAVLVVATPCPLILAAPAAIIAGVSFAARHGILVKGGGPLEALAHVSVVLLDKTGTVTSGRPLVVAVETFGRLSAGQFVALAASVEQLSIHPFAPAILSEASNRGLALVFPSDATEQMGTIIAGSAHFEAAAWSLEARHRPVPWRPNSQERTEACSRTSIGSARSPEDSSRFRRSRRADSSASCSRC